MNVRMTAVTKMLAALIQLVHSFVFVTRALQGLAKIVKVIIKLLQKYVHVPDNVK